MSDAHGAVSRLIQPDLNLEMTARIGGRDNSGAGTPDAIDLPALQPSGGVGMCDVVDARRAAAPRGFVAFPQFETGNGSENLARLEGNPLPVIEVTGLDIGDRSGGAPLGARGPAKPDLDQPFVDVAHLARPLDRPRSVGDILCQQAVIMPQMRARSRPRW